MPATLTPSPLPLDIGKLITDSLHLWLQQEGSTWLWTAAGTVAATAGAGFAAAKLGKLINSKFIARPWHKVLAGAAALVGLIASQGVSILTHSRKVSEAVATQWHERMKMHRASWQAAYTDAYAEAVRANRAAMADIPPPGELFSYLPCDGEQDQERIASAYGRLILEELRAQQPLLARLTNPAADSASMGFRRDLLRYMKSDSGRLRQVVCEEDMITSRLHREGAKGGDIQLSLMWNNLNDIDLHCQNPAGERIFFANRHDRAGGELDVDMNVTPPRISKEPVENIYWPQGNAPKGKYKVMVHHFRAKEPQVETPVMVRVKMPDTVYFVKDTLRQVGELHTIAQFEHRGSTRVMGMPYNARLGYLHSLETSKAHTLRRCARVPRVLICMFLAVALVALAFPLGIISYSAYKDIRVNTLPLSKP